MPRLGSPSEGTPGERHEAWNPSRLQSRQRPLRLRGHLDHAVDEGAGAAPRDLLQLPPVLHGQAEADRLGGPRRAVHPEVRQEEGTGRPGVAAAGGFGGAAGPPDVFLPFVLPREVPMDAITFQKLKDVEARYGEVETQMSDPAVVQDPSAYQRLAREAKELSPVVERYRAYK